MAKPTPSTDTLERALAEARGALGSASDVQRLRDKLGALPPAHAPAAPSASNGMSLGAKIAAGAAAGVLLIAGAMLLTTREPAGAAEPPRVVAPVQPELPAPPPGAPVAAAPAPPPEPAPEPARAITTQRRKPAKVEAPAAEPEERAPQGPKELELLTSAQDAIEASPQRALGLLGEHARLYPSGSFAQERESLAIDALRKLGRTTEAKERARAFVARFPKASNVKHLTRWLDESAAHDHNDEQRPLPTP